jgi:hypothetical protein
MNREPTKITRLQEQKLELEKQIAVAIEAAIPEIQEKVETFFKLIKEEYGIDIIQGEYEFTFNRDTEQEQDISFNFDV